MEWKSPQADLVGHVVICNCSEKVRRIVAELHAEIVVSKPKIVLIVQDNELWRTHPSWQPDPSNPFTRDHFFVVSGQEGETLLERLRRVNIVQARAAVILADPRQGELADARSTLVAVSIEQENPQVHTVMELLSSVNRAHLRATEVNEVVCQGEIAEKLISQSCITPGVKNIFQSLLTNTPGTNNIYISPVPLAVVGWSYRELARLLIAQKAPVILCGYLRSRPEKRLSPPPARLSSPSLTIEAASPEAWAQLDFVINPRTGFEPGRDTPLELADQLVIIACHPPKLEQYVQL